MEKSKMQVIVEELQAEVRKMSSMRGAIDREVSKLGVPMHITLSDAADQLWKEHERLEESTAKRFDVRGHPSDVLVCFNNAVEKSFGKLTEAATKHFFGKIPAETRTVT